MQTYQVLTAPIAGEVELDKGNYFEMGLRFL